MVEEETPIKFCPKCKSAELVQYAGGSIGMWKCKNCGFVSALFPEIVKIKNKKAEHGRRRKQQ